MSEASVMGNGNGHLLNLMDPESKTLLVTQKSGNGLTSLINRQIMQGIKNVMCFS